MKPVCKGCLKSCIVLINQYHIKSNNVVIHSCKIKQCQLTKHSIRVPIETRPSNSLIRSFQCSYAVLPCLGLSLLQSGFVIKCSANETVICDLGNPFKSNQKVAVCFLSVNMSNV